jgi:hypothetical protein
MQHIIRIYFTSNILEMKQTKGNETAHLEIG